MRAALIISGLLSALTTLGITAALAGSSSGIATAVLTGQFLSSFGVTAFCFFGAAVLRHLERQRADQARVVALLSELRDAFRPSVPPLDPAPVKSAERVEPRLNWSAERGV